MSVIRIKKSKREPYVILDTTALNDTRLSFRAKGIHTYLMSKKDDWQVYVTQLEKESPREGREAISAALKELEKAGYITRTRRRGERGRMTGWDTIVYETPALAAQDRDATENGLAEVGSTEVGSAELGSTELGFADTSNYGCKDVLTEVSIDKTSPPVSPNGETSPREEPMPRPRTKASKAPATNYADGYGHFWAAYPRKEGKVEAFRIWQDRNLEPRAGEIAAKVKRLTLTLWAGRERDKIPLPTTYLNQARYEDDLVPLEVAQQHLMRGRMTDREYRSMLAGQRFEERGNGTTGPLDLSDGDADVIDDVQYRIE